MIDATTNDRLHVATDGGYVPYIMLPVSQLDDVRRLLDAKKIAYWVDEHSVSLDDEPPVTVINLGRGADAAAVQMILDSEP